MNCPSDGKSGDAESTLAVVSQQWRRTAFPFLAVALLAVCELGGIKLQSKSAAWRSPFGMEELLWIAWYFSVVTLIGLCFELSTAMWPRRVLGLILGVTLLLAIFRLTSPPSGSGLFVIAAPQLVVIIGLSAISRRLGMLVSSVNVTPVCAASRGRFDRTQFSIFDLLLWTAGFAVMFWVAKGAEVRLSSLAEDWLIIGSFGGVFGGVALCAAWAALAAGSWPVRTAVLAAAMPIAAEVCNLLGSPKERSFWYSLIAAQLIFVAAAMLVFRADGYRLMRRSTLGLAESTGQQQADRTQPD